MLATRSIALKTFISFLISFFLVSASQVYASAVSFVESLQESQSGLGNLGCTDAVVTSPDDKFAYSSSFCDHALNIFSRDPVTGKNTLLSSIVGNETTGEGLRNVQWLAMHPSGKYLFAFGRTGTPYNDANKFRSVLYTYERDLTTGSLTYKSELNSSLIDSAWNMHISADGHFLYLGRQYGIEVIQISGNGVLTHTQSVPKTSTLSETSYIRSFVFSPDNKYIYVDSGNNSISWLLRDAITGALTYGGELLSKGMIASISSLRIRSLGKSNDGKHLYAFIEPNDLDKTVLRHFSIANDGSLTFVDDIVTTPAAGAFFCPSEIIVSKNDKLVYFVDGCADNFQIWLRDIATGSLKYIGVGEEGTVKDNIPQFAFSQVNNIGFSNDGHFAIAAVNAGVTTLNLTADIILASNFQQMVTVKNSFSGTISVTNNGPVDAHDIEITLTGNALASLKTANMSLPQGSCNLNNGTLVCKLPSVPNGAVETIELTLQAPDALGSLQINASKTQAEIDPDAQTDSLQILVQSVTGTTQSSSSSSSSAQSVSAQSSSASQQAASTPPKKGGGSMGFEWVLLLFLFFLGRTYRK